MTTRMTSPALIVLTALVFLAGPSTANAQSNRESLRIVEKMVDAHGGMAKWQAAPTVRFRDEFLIGGESNGFPSRVTVEHETRRVYMDFPGTDMRMSWDGTKAWSENWTHEAPPRFLAQLSFYLSNLPWVMMDPGVELGAPGTSYLWDDPTEYFSIKATFAPGTGDSPNDYFLLFIDTKTYRLHACEYIVTNKAVLPDNVASTRPLVIVYDEHTTVDGLLVPTHYTIYQADRTAYGSCRFSDWSFSTSFDERRMIKPKGAIIDTSMQ